VVALGELIPVSNQTSSGEVGSGYYSSGEAVIEILWDLADLGIAGVLGILGLKVLRGECFSSILSAA
jgi:hypothetical protein